MNCVLKIVTWILGETETDQPVVSSQAPLHVANNQPSQQIEQPYNLIHANDSRNHQCDQPRVLAYYLHPSAMPLPIYLTVPALCTPPTFKEGQCVCYDQHVCYDQRVCHNAQPRHGQSSSDNPELRLALQTTDEQSASRHGQVSSDEPTNFYNTKSFNRAETPYYNLKSHRESAISQVSPSLHEPSTSSESLSLHEPITGQKLLSLHDLIPNLESLSFNDQVNQPDSFPSPEDTSLRPLLSNTVYLAATIIAITGNASKFTETAIDTVSGLNLVGKIESPEKESPSAIWDEDLVSTEDDNALENYLSLINNSHKVTEEILADSIKILGTGKKINHLMDICDQLVPMIPEDLGELFRCCYTAIRDVNLPETLLKLIFLNFTNNEDIYNEIFSANMFSNGKRRHSKISPMLDRLTWIPKIVQPVVKQAIKNLIYWIDEEIFEKKHVVIEQYNANTVGIRINCCGENDIEQVFSHLEKKLGFEFPIKSLRIFHVDFKTKWNYAIQLSNQTTRIVFEACKFKNNSFEVVDTDTSMLNSISQLIIKDCKIETVNESIELLRNLKMLEMNGHELKTLPENIGDLNWLKILRVTNGKLSLLPDSIQRLNNLKTISLTNNELENIPDSVIRLKGLEKLFIGDNRISKLPKSMKGLETLKVLVLDGNDLRADNSGNLKLKSIEKLSIAECKVESLPKFVFKMNKTLKMLRCDEIVFSESVEEIKKNFPYLNFSDIKDEDEVVPNPVTGASTQV